MTTLVLHKCMGAGAFSDTDQYPEVGMATAISRIGSLWRIGAAMRVCRE
jgi:hypothetical protein